MGFFPFDQARRAVPDFWRNLLCDTPAPNPNPPPFTGGQCTFQYNHRYNRTQYPFNNCVASTGTGGSNGYWGPITNFSTFTEPVGTGVTGYFMRFNHHGLGGARQQNPVTATIEYGRSANTCPATTLNSNQFIPTGGQPDNCGDPPPNYDPVEPGDVTINTNITYDNSSGVSVTIPVVLVYARAQLDVDANITIPFTLNLTPTVNFSGTVNFNGEVNIGTVPNGTGTRPKDPRKGDCGDISEPVVEPPTDPTDSEQPPQPDRERETVIKGVLVTVTALSNERASLLVQSDNPDIYVPSLGHVQFLCRVGATSAAWTSDQPVKNRRNLIPCPWEDGAIDVRGTPQPGVTWTLTPIRGYAGIPVEYVEA